MDNIETTETKKKIHIGISDIFFILIFLIVLGFFIYLKVVGKELFLFGYVWNSTDIGNILYMLAVSLIFISYIIKPKSKSQKNIMILCTVLFVLGAGRLADSAYGKIKNKVDTEQITFSDGKEVMLLERIGYVKSILVKYEATYTYMDVYQINGITAKRLGETGEQYFTNKSLLNDIYTYEYDEESKKLTLHHKEEYNIEIWEKEFILE